jgi:Cof subfamily protein (haloacid dehalogenase superfamily)
MLMLGTDIAKRLSHVRLVLMDIDGTLVTANKKSIANVLVQLRRLKPLGIGFSLATGRTIQGTSDLVNDLLSVGMRMPPMVTYNGGVVLSGRDSYLIKRRLLQRAAFRDIVNACRTDELPILAYACRTRLDLTPIETVYSESRSRPKAEFNGMWVRHVGNLLDIEDDFIAILVNTPPQIDSAALTRHLASRLGNQVRVTTSGGRYVEICHPEATKLRGMVDLATMLRIELDSIMAIGDNFNDRDMIEAAGVGVAVSNAPPEVLDIARLRCTRAAAEGVVEALRMLVHAARTLKKERSGELVS